MDAVFKVHSAPCQSGASLHDEVGLSDMNKVRHDSCFVKYRNDNKMNQNKNYSGCF